MTMLDKAERILDLTDDNLTLSEAMNLLLRLTRRLGEPLIGELCLRPDDNGLDCHSRTAEPSQWCNTCLAFGVEIGEV